MGIIMTLLLTILMDHQQHTRIMWGLIHALVPMMENSNKHSATH
jgi:hypothetical protein